MRTLKSATPILVITSLVFCSRGYADLTVDSELAWSLTMRGAHFAEIATPGNGDFTEFDAIGTLTKDANLADSVASPRVVLSGAAVTWLDFTSAIKQGCNYYVAYTKADFFDPQPIISVRVTLEDEDSHFLYMPNCQ